METLLLYLAKAAALTGVFFLAYHLLLRKETFFLSNRRFLLAGLFTSAIFPLLVFKRVIWVDPAPQASMQTIDLNILLRMQHMPQLLKQSESIAINWIGVFTGIYLAGVALFLIRFILDIRSIRKILKSNNIIKDGPFSLIDSNRIQSPFSFFNYIVVNSGILEQEELDSIICHEKVHSAQNHSLDMIVSQLFCAIFWFNPIAWLYKKSIAQNLEFIADAEAIKMLNDRKAYQKTLLKITVQPECIAITNHFYQSLIKKRIVMLNKQKSTQWNSWKYVVVVPALIAFVIMFQVKVVAQEKQPATGSTTIEKMKFIVEVNKDATDADLAEESKAFKAEFDADVNFENIKRNTTEEITAIRVTVSDKGQSQVYEVSGNEPIKPFTIEVEKDGAGRNTIAFGTNGGGFSLEARDFYIVGDDRDASPSDSLRMRNNRILRSYGNHSFPAPPAPSVDAPWSVNTMRIGDADKLVVINGIKQKKGSDAIKLPAGQEVVEINVLEGKKAKKKYGKEAKEGAIEITTRKNGGRLMITGPSSFSYAIPGDEGSFQIEIPDMNFEFPEFDGEAFGEGFEGFPDMAAFENLGDFTMNITSELSEEEMRAIRAELESAQLEIEEAKRELRLQQRGQNQRIEFQKTREELKKELEEAKKEIEEARKELEKSKKDQQKRSY